MEINNRIFALLTERRYTQHEFAERIGVSYKTVSAWKARGSNPPSEYIPAIAEFFNVSAMYILTGEEDTCVCNKTNDEDEARAIEYYRRLNFEDQDYIKGEMIRLYKSHITCVNESDTEPPVA